MNVIAAVDSRWGIGYKGRLLFSVPEDMKRVRQLTEGQTLVMGRKTFDSLPGGKPLPNRHHIVLTRNPNYAAEGVTTCRSLEELANALKDIPSDTVWSFGGADVYKLLLPYCQTAYITKFHAVKEADSRFPDLDADPAWKLQEESSVFTSGVVTYQFCEYKQKGFLPL